MNRAEEYAAAVAKGREDQPLEYLLMPSSTPEKPFKWGLAKPDLQAWVLTGRLPQSLLEEGMKAWRKQGIVTSEPVDMADADVLDSMIFMREIVREACQDPRIGDGPGEVLPMSMDVRDFMFIFQWAVGGAGLDGLHTFRAGRERGAAGTRANRKKQRRTRKQPVPGK